MCGRFYLETDIDELAERYEIKELEQVSFLKGEVFPTNVAPIVINDGVRKIVESRWDYPIPGISKTTINARVETIAEKASFSKSVHNRRCIVPANAFFEWQNEGRGKTKFKITQGSGNLISMAGIYNMFIDKSGRPYLGFVIITKEANEIMSKLHHRMPLILTRKYESIWLDKDINSKADISVLLHNITKESIDLRLSKIANKNSHKQLSFIE